MYTLDILNDKTALKYQSFTFPSFRSLLESDLAVDRSVVAIAASHLDQPIGLALAAIKQQKSSAEVLSIFVEQSYRNKGIGTALLEQLEQELIERACERAELVYTTGKETTSVLEHLLRKCNWTSPTPRMLMCRGKAEIIMEAAWMKRYSRLPSSYSIFPWIEITQAERQDIQLRQKLQPWIPDDLIPFQYERNLEPLNSLGLRYEGQVVGWVINHRLSEDTIRYTCSFVREDLQKMGRIISLYAEAGKRQLSANVPNCIWTVPLFHESMVNFVKHRWSPFLTSLNETKGAFKLLKN